MNRIYILAVLGMSLMLTSCWQKQSLQYIGDLTVSICAKTTGPECTPIGKWFFVSYDGTLVTSAHLVSGGGKMKRVETSSGSYVFQIEEIYESRDIALLSLPYTTTSPRLLGTGVALGESVYMFKDYFFYTGSVVWVGLKKHLGTSFFSRPQDYADLIEIDIPVEAGDSGLPVFNTNGKVVGMIIARSTEGTGSYVVPIRREMFETK